MFKRRSFATLFACGIVVAGCGATPSQSALLPSGPAPTPGSSGWSTPTDDQPSVGAVVATEPVVLRTAPGTGDDSTILETRLYPGMRFSILEGPEMASGYAWFRVRIGDVEGWSAAASKEGEPWLASVHNGSVAISRDVPTPGGNPHPQVILVAEDGAPVQITFLTHDDVTRQTTTAAVRPVLTCGYGIYGGGWSPAGDQLVATVGGCETAMFAVDESGVTFRWLGQGTGPRWSPSGTEIAHGLNLPYLPCAQACASEPLGPWEVTLTNASSGTTRPLTSNGAWFVAFEPDWSPDGTRVAFTGGVLGEQSWSVYLVNADGSNQRHLADGVTATWSPDGSRLLFVGLNAAQESEAWLMEADGSQPRRLAEAPAWGATWSPDASWIALRNAEERAVLISADGTLKVDLGPGSPLGWSPDGRYVVVRRGDVPAALVAIDPTDGTEHPIAEFGEGMWSYLGWQPIYIPLIEPG